MGKQRRATERLPCAMCGAAGYSPCISRTTGREMKGNHGPRASAGRHDHLNATLRKIDGMDEQFWMWVHRFFGLSQHDYPVKLHPREWTELYQQYPELNPADQYHGEW